MAVTQADGRRLPAGRMAYLRLYLAPPYIGPRRRSQTQHSRFRDAHATPPRRIAPLPNPRQWAPRWKARGFGSQIPPIGMRVPTKRRQPILGQPRESDRLKRTSKRRGLSRRRHFAHRRDSEAKPECRSLNDGVVAHSRVFVRRGSADGTLYDVAMTLSLADCGS